MSTCLPYLEQQIEIIQPRVLVALGGTAMAGRPKTSARCRNCAAAGIEFRGIPLMATYHPSYLLRSQALSEKRKVWEDMLLVLEKLGLPSPRNSARILPKHSRTKGAAREPAPLPRRSDGTRVEGAHITKPE